MTRPIEAIAAQIRASGRPFPACISTPFVNGNRATVWGDLITPTDFAKLQALLKVDQPAQSTPDQRARAMRAMDDAHERAERRRR